jgi:hypothetical protein
MLGGRGLLKQCAVNSGYVTTPAGAPLSSLPAQAGSPAKLVTSSEIRHMRHRRFDCGLLSEQDLMKPEGSVRTASGPHSEPAGTLEMLASLAASTTEAWYWCSSVP